MATTSQPDPLAIIRSRGYVGALVLTALIGAPISAIAYAFLAVVDGAQGFLYEDLPGILGFADIPPWWPAPLLVLSGLLVGLSISRLSGNGGHSPALGLTVGGSPVPAELPGIALAALATLALGAVLGPEAPLIAIGGGLGALTVKMVKRDAPPPTIAVISAAGSFAAISTLLGSPLLGAFLIMEAAAIGGGMMSVALLPGLLAAGIGSLVFVGLDAFTGLGTFSLAIPDLPAFEHADRADVRLRPAVRTALPAAGLGDLHARPIVASGGPSQPGGDHAALGLSSRSWRSPSRTLTEGVPRTCCSPVRLPCRHCCPTVRRGRSGRWSC